MQSQIRFCPMKPGVFVGHGWPRLGYLLHPPAFSGSKQPESAPRSFVPFILSPSCQMPIVATENTFSGLCVCAAHCKISPSRQEYITFRLAISFCQERSRSNVHLSLQCTLRLRYALQCPPIWTLGAEVSSMHVQRMRVAPIASGPCKGTAPSSLRRDHAAAVFQYTGQGARPYNPSFLCARNHVPASSFRPVPKPARPCPLGYGLVLQVVPLGISFLSLRKTSWLGTLLAFSWSSHDNKSVPAKSEGLSVPPLTHPSFRVVVLGFPPFFASVGRLPSPRRVPGKTGCQSRSTSHCSFGSSYSVFGNSLSLSCVRPLSHIKHFGMPGFRLIHCHIPIIWMEDNDTNTSGFVPPKCLEPPIGAIPGGHRPRKCTSCTVTVHCPSVPPRPSFSLCVAKYVVHSLPDFAYSQSASKRQSWPSHSKVHRAIRSPLLSGRVKGSQPGTSPCGI